MALDNDWFTEIHAGAGTAFSLKGKKVHEEQTPFQKIAIYETETFGNLMIIDDCTMVSDRDNFTYHEMMTHPALYTLDNPTDVLVIGGGDCGTLKEVLKHDTVNRAVQVEIDERVTRLAEQYFPDLCSSNNDSRAELLFEDAIKWIKEAPAESLDLIIVDSTDPIGPAEGLFSKPFYEDCMKALRPGGIVIQQSESPLLHMHLLKDMHHAMHSANFTDVRTIQFPVVIYPSGWWSATMARKDKNIEGYREKEAQNKKFETRYYSADMHKAAFVMPVFFKKELG